MAINAENKGLLVFGIFLMFSVVVSAGIASADTLFEEDFSLTNPLDEGWIGDYFEEPETEGIYNDIVTANDAFSYVGYSARIDDEAAMIRTISTEGYEDIEFSYCRRTFGIEGSDDFRIGWKIGDYNSSQGEWNGGDGDEDWDNWNQLEAIQGFWGCADFELEGAENQEAISVAFFMDNLEGGIGLVDDVALTGSEMIDEVDPLCSVDYVEHEISHNVYEFDDTIYIGEDGEFIGFGDSWDDFSNIANVQYNRSSPDTSLPLEAGIPSDGLFNEPEEIWQTDDDNPDFIDGWHSICCRAADSAGNVGDFSDSCQEFCIDTQDPDQVVGVAHSNPSACVANYVNEAPVWTWDESGSNGCSPLDYYEVELYLSDGTFVGSYETEDTEFEVPGGELNNSQDYYIRVRAVDAAGNIGAWSNPTGHVYYDIEDPEVEILTDDEVWYNVDFNLEEEDSDNLGLYTCEIAISNDGNMTLGWTFITCNEDFLVDISEYCPSDGEDNCEVWKRVKDNACNVNEDHAGFDIDRVDPVTTKIVSGHQWPGAGEFCFELEGGEGFDGGGREADDYSGSGPDGTSVCDSATQPEQCSLTGSDSVPPFVFDTVLSEGGNESLLEGNCGDILILSSGDPSDGDTELNTDMGNPGCGSNPDGFETYDCTILEGFTPDEDSVILAVSSEWPEWLGSSFTDWMQIFGGNVSVDISIDDWGTANVIPYDPADSGTKTLAVVSGGTPVSLRIADSGDHALDTALIVVPLSCIDEAGDPLLCGDGNLDIGEECDDGNNDDGDGCSSLCLLEDYVCGNGILEGPEECDDGNNDDGDGCSATCEIEGDEVCLPVDLFVNEDTEFSFECDDEDSGCNVTWFRIYSEDTGEWSEWMEYDGSFDLGDIDGHYVIEYYSEDSVDVSGPNVEEHWFEVDKLDNIPPVTSKTYGTPSIETDWLLSYGWKVITPAHIISPETSITLDAEDEEVGVNATFYQILVPVPYDNPEVQSEYIVEYFGEITQEWYYHDQEGYEECVDENGGYPDGESNCVETYWMYDYSYMNNDILCIKDYDPEGASGEWCNYKDSFNVPINSDHKICFFSQDHLWNMERPYCQVFSVDGLGPEITLLNPTEEEAENVQVCSQSIFALAEDDKSDVVSAWAELINDSGEGEVVRSVDLEFVDELGNGWHADPLMNKELPAGDYLLKVYAEDSVGNIGVFEMEEYLAEGVFVEHLSDPETGGPAVCQLDIDDGGQCEFRFHACVRGADSVSMWMSKIDGLVDPFMLDATIHKNNNSAFVGLKQGELLVPEPLSNEDFLLDLDEGIINGQTTFDLSLTFDQNDTQAIGPGAHTIDYLLKAFSTEVV